MDSMKTLNRSLPNSSILPPEKLLQAFKTAALSVTNLYKTAAIDQARARQAGYQDALDALLAFLDKENLGLGDGEGWRVRQWATERLDGSGSGQAGSESDDDRGEIEKRSGSPSPTVIHKIVTEPIRQQALSRSSSPSRVDEVRPPPPPSVPSPQRTNTGPQTETFSFRSSHPFPADVEMQPSEPIQQPELIPHNQPPLVTPAVRVEVLPRGSRTPHRHNSHTNRHSTRSSTALRSLGSGAGSKRRMAFGDFFDIGNLGDGVGGGGNGKRSRMS